GHPATTTQAKSSPPFTKCVNGRPPQRFLGCATRLVSSVELLDLQRLLLSLYPSVATRGKNMKIAHAALLASAMLAMACGAGRTAAQQHTHVKGPSFLRGPRMLAPLKAS